MQNRFTKKAQKVLRDAGKVAQELGHNYVGTEHLLVALIRNPGVASEVLKANGVEEQKIFDLIDESISAQSSVLVADEGEFTPRTQKVLEIAQEEASRMGIADAGTEHLLIALLKESDCIAVRLLNTNQCTEALCGSTDCVRTGHEHRQERIHEAEEQKE